MQDFYQLEKVAVPVSTQLKPVKNISYKYVEAIFTNTKKLFDTKILLQKRVKIKKLEQSLIRHTDIFSRVALAFIYIQMDNHALADKILSSLLEKELFELTFELFVPSSHRKELLTNFLNLLQRIDEKIKNKKLWNTFIVYLYHFADKEIQEEMLDSLDVITSPIKIRNMSESLNYGYTYPSVWFPLLKKNFGMSLAEKYLEKSSFYTNLQQKKLSLMWILQDYFPTNKQHRKIIFTAFKQLQKSKKLYNEDMLFRLLENEAFRIFLMQNDDQFKRPMFVKKRKHYKRLLEKGIARDYALYNLILLGDYNPNYLIYML